MTLSSAEFDRELAKHPKWTTITIKIVGEYPINFKIDSTPEPPSSSGDLVEIGDPRHTIARSYYSSGSYYTKEKEIIVAVKSTTPEIIPKIIEFVKTQGPKLETDDSININDLDDLDDEDEFEFVWQEWTPSDILQGVNHYLADIGAWDKAKELGHF